jgi:hypothetical protein
MGCIIFVKPYEGKESMANKEFWKEHDKGYAAHQAVVQKRAHVDCG